jgi:hypothetical protein
MTRDLHFIFTVLIEVIVFRERLYCYTTEIRLLAKEYLFTRKMD